MANLEWIGMSYPLPKDPQVAAYLNHLRKRNVQMASKCYNCNKETIGINSDGYRIMFVCQDHYENKPDVKLDASVPGVLHYVYPNGKEVAKNMMDPNVGGWKKVEKEL